MEEGEREKKKEMEFVSKTWEGREEREGERERYGYYDSSAKVKPWRGERG